MSSSSSMPFGLSAGLIASSAIAAMAMVSPAFADSSSQELSPSLFQNWTLDETQATEDYNFEGIVGLGNCSGSLVRFTDSVSTDKGLILTNGHCVSILKPREIRVNESSRKRFTVLNPDSSDAGRVRASKLLYAAMYRTDLAIYELRETYEEIEQKFGTQPLTMSEKGPTPGTPIEVISGYWKRGYSCFVDRIVYQLQEGDWSFFDSIKYTDEGCVVIGGTSGSPIVNADTREVVGVNNTGNESGRECKVNNPCEIDEAGNVEFKKDWSYGQQTHWLYSCRNESGAIDLNQEGCKLAKPGDE